MKRDHTAATTARTPTGDALSSDSFRDLDTKLSRSTGESTAEWWREECKDHRAEGAQVATVDVLIMAECNPIIEGISDRIDRYELISKSRSLDEVSANEWHGAHENRHTSKSVIASRSRIAGCDNGSE